jgi:hypothetical protein
LKWISFLCSTADNLECRPVALLANQIFLYFAKIEPIFKDYLVLYNFLNCREVVGLQQMTNGVQSLLANSMGAATPTSNSLVRNILFH